MKLLMIGYYSAPPVPSVHPVQIQENRVLAELVTSGYVYFPVNGKMQICGPGSLFWHRPGQKTIHKNVPEDPYRCYTYLFKGELNDKIPRFSIWKQDFISFTQETFDYFHQVQNRDPVFSDYIMLTLKWIALSHSRRLGSSGISLPFKLLLDTVASSPGKDYSLEDMNAISGLSIPYLHILFKRYKNKTPHQYILSSRIQYSRLLLAGSNQSVKEISYKCGFKAPESFCRSFRKHMGKTPGDYRRLYSREQHFNRV